MDLRRWGEFAFGIGVFMCGGAFLLLALERLNAPVLTGAPASAAPFVAAVRPPSVARIAIVRRPAAAGRARHRHAIAARPHPTAVMLVAAAPVAERRRPMSQPANHAVHRPANRRSAIPRILAIANPTHRSKNSRDRSPVSEKTPEPPIGYDDHPALLHSDGPNAAMPTMEPVQVELTTTHLGH